MPNCPAGTCFQGVIRKRKCHLRIAGLVKLPGVFLAELGKGISQLKSCCVTDGVNQMEGTAANR